MLLGGGQNSNQGWGRFCGEFLPPVHHKFHSSCSILPVDAFEYISSTFFFDMLGHDQKDFAYKKPHFFEKFHFNCPVVPKVSPNFFERHKVSVNVRDVDLAQFETSGTFDWGLRSESCTGNLKRDDVIFSCREFWDCRWLIFENVLHKQLCFYLTLHHWQGWCRPKDYFPKSYINQKSTSDFSTSIPRVIPTNPPIPGNLASAC